MARLRSMTEISVEDRKRLAAQIGVHEQYLYQCLTGRRDMDPEAAMQAEIATSAELKRQMLCQHSFQRVWPDLKPLAAANDERKARA